MPFTAAGELSLSAECDLGELGPERGKPVLHSWPWTNHLWTLLPLALLLPPLLSRRNRSLQVAAVLLPVLAIYLAWVPLAGLWGDGAADLELMLGMVAVGLGMACLATPWLAAGGRLRTWGLALFVALAAEALVALALSAGSLPADGPFAVIAMIGTAILISCVVFAAFSCGGRFTIARYLLHLVVWLVVTTPVAMFFLTVAVGGGVRLADLAIGVVVFGLGGLLAASPFLLLALFSRTHRQRFGAALGVPR